MLNIEVESSAKPCADAGMQPNEVVGRFRPEDLDIVAADHKLVVTVDPTISRHYLKSSLTILIITNGSFIQLTSQKANRSAGP